MILADTSVWVGHFRRGSTAFAPRLEQGEIAIHAVVLGELATGNLARRQQTLAALHNLPRVKEGSSEECLAYLETHRLFGRGIVGMTFNSSSRRDSHTCIFGRSIAA